MLRTTRTLALLAAPTLTAFALAGCGSDESKPTPATSSAAATKGGDFTGTYSSFPDYLDPALAYSQEAWTTLWPVYPGLLTYKHAEGAEGAELEPALAEALPEISADGLTYTLKLRPDLKYSDGSPVKASDFEHTIKRVLNLESGASGYYLAIEGAEAYVKAGKSGGDISGITADDATGEITIKLAEKDGQFSYYLAMDFSGLVKGDTPFENTTSKPAIGAGAYVLSDVKPNRSVTLTRNPNFRPLPNVPDGRADSITIKAVKNQRREAQDVLQDKVDFMIDPPTPDQIPEIKADASDRYKEESINSTYYFFLNQKVAPFDDERVRQAVGWAVDERALARIFGGLLQPSCNFLPPGLIGYKKVSCPWGEPGTADLQKAKDLIKQAGAEGAPVKVWGLTGEPTEPITEYLADTLNQIGLKATPSIVDGSVFFQTTGNQKTKAQTGFANWFQDFPSPANFFFLVDGASIQATNNQNPGNVDDPELDKLIADAKANPDPEAVAGEWAKADQLLVDKAYVIPYGSRKLTKYTSSRVDFGGFLFHPVNAQDLTTLGLR